MININTSPDKLKKSILQDAMQGKLTEQSSQDGDATDLLQSIDKEKQRLIKAGKIKKQKKLSPVRDDEKPFSIPDNWQWARLRSICNLINGRAYKQSELFQDETLTPILRVGNLFTNKQWYYSNLQLPENKYIDYGDLIYAWSASFGPRIWYGNKVIFHYHIWKVMMEGMDKSFLYYLLDFITGKVKSSSHGTSIQNITKTKMEEFLVPIPPLAEQKRIVTKLDALLPKVDSLKESVNSIQALRNELPSRLRRSLLQSAMQGQLTQQSSEDGDATDLLQSIDKKKQRLIKAGKIKKQKKLSPVRDDEIPFKIPDNWQWTRLSNVTDIIMGQSPKSKFVYEGVPDNNHFEFHQGKSSFGDEMIQKSNKVTDQYSRLINDSYILMSVRAPVGDINMTNREIDLGRGLCGISPIGFSKLYLYYYLKTQKAPLMRKATGSTFKAINKKIIFNELIPIPPLAEQKRIVNKLDSMFEHINNM